MNWSANVSEEQWWRWRWRRFCPTPGDSARACGITTPTRTASSRSRGTTTMCAIHLILCQTAIYAILVQRSHRVLMAKSVPFCLPMPCEVQFFYFDSSWFGWSDKTFCHEPIEWFRYIFRYLFSHIFKRSVPKVLALIRVVQTFSGLILHAFL